MVESVSLAYLSRSLIMHVMILDSASLPRSTSLPKSTSLPAYPLILRHPSVKHSKSKRFNFPELAELAELADLRPGRLKFQVDRLELADPNS